MADTSTASSSKFSLTKPNAKTYLIVGGVALGVGLLYFWYKNKKAAATTGSGTGTTVYYPSPTGLSASQLLAWISDHQSSPKPSPPGSPPPPGGGGGGGTVTVPKVTGERANFAIGKLESSGLSWHGNPERDPQHEYTVVSQTPGPGKTVPRGSVVDLAFQQIG